MRNFSFYFAGALAVCGAAVFAAIAPAAAQTCGAYPDHINFGTLNANGMGNPPVAGQITVNCGNLPAGRTLKYCLILQPNSAEQNRGDRILWLGGAVSADFSRNNIRFNLYYNNTAWGADSGNNDYGSPITGTVATGGFTPQALPLTTAFNFILGANTPAGLYSNRFMMILNYNWSRDDIAPSALCGTGKPDAADGWERKPLTVSANLKTACSISSVDSINFGKMIRLSDARDQTGTISVRCSGDTNFRLDAGLGLHADGFGTRSMQNTQKPEYGIQYQLFQADGVSPWTTKWPGDDLAHPIRGSYGDIGVYRFIARLVPLVPGQATPPPGVYTDTVIITLTNTFGE